MSVDSCSIRLVKRVSVAGLDTIWSEEDVT